MNRKFQLALLVTISLAAPFASAADEEPPAIAGGREQELLSLLEPYRNGVELVPGWKVISIEVPKTHVRFVIEGPRSSKAALLLKHPSQSESAERSASFDLEREPGAPEESKAALDKLAATISRNDKGGFWETGPQPERKVHQEEEAEQTGRGEPLPGTEHAPLSMQETLVWRAYSPIWSHPPGWDFSRGVNAPWYRDGILIALLALILVAAHLRRSLAEAPRWVPWTLLGFVVAGGLLRWAMSPETVLNAWPYTRSPPLVFLVMNGPVLAKITDVFGLQIHYTDAIHVIDFILATAAPVAFFVHARFALKDWRLALFAAGLLVVLPIHIHFSRSDVEYVQSLVTSSLTFTALYMALRDESPRWRVVGLVMLPLLSLATYLIRPENMVFAAVDVGAILLTAGRDVPLRRRALVLSIVVLVAIYAFVTHLLLKYGTEVDGGLSLETIGAAVRLLFNFKQNTLLNFWITPPLLIILSATGFVTLLRSGEWRRALYFSSWLAAFFVVHSYVVPSEPAMMARYHMHLITPTLMLAGASLPLLLTAPRWAQISLLATIMLFPAMHSSFIGTRRFDLMVEYDLLRQTREQIPADCTVLEFLGADKLSDPMSLGDSRFVRHAAVLRKGRPDARWRFVALAQVPPSADGALPRAEVLTPEAEGLLEKPPECLVFLEGMTCATHRPADVPRAPVCDEVLTRMRTETLGEVTFPAAVYDERGAGRLDDAMNAVRDGSIGLVKLGAPMRFAIHRLHAKDKAPEPAQQAPAPD